MQIFQGSPVDAPDLHPLIAHLQRHPLPGHAFQVPQAEASPLLRAVECVYPALNLLPERYQLYRFGAEFRFQLRELVYTGLHPV